MAGKRKKSTSRSEKGSGGKTAKFPDRSAIIDFIAENPGKAGKREIARAFSIKGQSKIALKALLKDLQEEGIVEKSGKQLKPAGALPSVTLLDIVSRDEGGRLIGKPTKDSHYSGENPPSVEILPSRKQAQAAGIGMRVLARIEANAGEGAPFTGRIIKIIEKQARAELGILKKVSDGYRVVPITRKQDELKVSEHELNGAEVGDLVEVAPISTRRHQGLKSGKIVDVVGQQITEKAASMIAIHANGIPHIFPDAVLAEAGDVKPIASTGNIPASHEDWRDLPLITIDPADAKDHDDAIHGMADPDNEGGFIATVAIADVSYYVRPGSKMDREALLRGNSVYFPDRVVPMLPERISNDLCSLREGEDRPALAVRMWFDEKGQKRKHSFHRVVMRSHAKLSYPEAQAAADGDTVDKIAELTQSVIEPLWATYDCLKRGRQNRSPLDLDLPERKILLNNDGTVDRVIVPERLDAHRLVEEFMIQANVCAAETLQLKRQRLIYRTHDNPSLDKLESLREFLKTVGLSLAKSGSLRANHFNQILAAAKGEDYEELLNQVVLRSQSQAEYSPDNIGHFGLNLRNYAHFTSPIRRYADLIVHRALVRALDLGPGGITPEEEKLLEEIAADISMTERRAMQAERDTIDRLIASHLSERIGERFTGRINGVTKAGLFVTLSDTGADGFVPISKISEEYYHFDPASHAIIGADSGLAYQIGMIVDVRLAEAAPVAGALRFDLLSEGRKLPGIQRSRPTNRSRMRAGNQRRSPVGARRGRKR